MNLANPCLKSQCLLLCVKEGASDADISMLSRFRYSELDGDGEKFLKEGLMVPDLNNRGITSNERVLPKEDAVSFASYGICSLIQAKFVLD